MKHDQLYIDMATLTAHQSHDEEIQVGSVIVRDGQVLSQGWNGMPSGMPNATRSPVGATRKEVIHSEANALMKLAKNGGGSNGATIYCTHSPCWDCAKLLLQAGITRIVYSHCYDEGSVLFLKERGLDLECIKPSDRVSAPEGRTDQYKQSEG